MPMSGTDAAGDEPEGQSVRAAARTQTAPPPDEPVAADEHGSRNTRWLPWGLGVVLTGLYALYSLWRHANLGTGGYDLGIFDQAVRSYAHFHAPVSSFKGPGFDVLGDHFSPIIALLAPLYWIWPNAAMLLVAQAVLVGLSAVPVTRLAIGRLGAVAGLAIGIAYGLSWGVQGAVAFDFHEVAFAAPLLAFSLEALVNGRWRTAACWALPLALVKEDLGITVALIGCYLFARRQRRLGVALALGGVAATALAVLVIIPSINHIQGYRYWVYVDGDGQIGQVPTGGTLWHILATLPHTLVTPSSKLWLLVALLGITGFLALGSPLVLLVVPTLLWRLSTQSPQYWSTGPVQYNLPLMPILFVALTDTLASGRLRRLGGALVRPLSRGRPRAERFRLRPGDGVRAVALGVLAISLAVLPKFSFWQLTSYHGPNAHVDAAHHVASLVPSGATVSATNFLVPLVVDRCDVINFPDVNHVRPRYYLLDTTDLTGFPLPFGQLVAAYDDLPQEGYILVAQDDGVVLYGLAATGGAR